MEKTSAIILAAGKGSRMKSECPKQFMEVGGKPLFLYSVEKFLNHVDQVILVVSQGSMEFCEQVLKKYRINSRVAVCSGGEERYHSSINGLKMLHELGEFSMVMIHDAARALISDEVITRVKKDTLEYGASIAAVPVKDTIKAADGKGYVANTPDREQLWIVQTPQGFMLPVISEAYENFQKQGKGGLTITDDAMVVENYTEYKVKLTIGSYENIKVTTPEDLIYLDKL